MHHISMHCSFTYAHSIVQCQCNTNLIIQNKNISPMFVFFFREDQPHSKAKLRPRSLRLHQFCFSSGVALVFFFPAVSACVLTRTRTQPVTRTAMHTQLIHPLSRTCDTPAGLQAPPTRGRGWRPGGGIFVGGDEPGSSAESGHSFSMGPFTHMSDSVADSGRGTSGVSPSRVGGPENCDRFWFTSVHNYVWVLRFVVLLFCKISWFVNFGCPQWSLADIFVFLCKF